MEIGLLDMSLLRSTLLKKASYGLVFGRSLNFTVQSTLLPLIDTVIGGNADRSFTKFGQHIKATLPKVQSLIEKDSENIAKGYYPLSVLFQESPVKHYMRVPFLIEDAIRAQNQRRKKQTALFEEVDQDFVNSAPDYYQRNFHFQKGGYLSDASAKLYDHQVEILFFGMAQVMRRQLIPILKNHFDHSTGEGLRFLEIGSGTGALTYSIALAFPKAQITCLDISPHYLQYARRRLDGFKRIDFLQGLGEKLNFKEESFDAVFSCFLFHEIPQNIRQRIVAEKKRVLKSDGFLGVVDSIQKNDDMDLNWALKQFPVDFHEPFYKNYTENPLEDLLKSEGLNNVQSEIHFLTKILYSVK